MLNSQRSQRLRNRIQRSQWRLVWSRHHECWAHAATVATTQKRFKVKTGAILHYLAWTIGFETLLRCHSSQCLNIVPETDRQTDRQTDWWVAYNSDGTMSPIRNSNVIINIFSIINDFCQEAVLSLTRSQQFLRYANWNIFYCITSMA